MEIRLPLAFQPVWGASYSRCEAACSVDGVRVEADVSHSVINAECKRVLSSPGHSTVYTTLEQPGRRGRIRGTDTPRSQKCIYHF